MIRTLAAAMTTALALAVSPVSAPAEDWTPPGPIKLMIAFAAGGGADTQARLIAEDLEARLGWQFIPEQVTGRAGLNLAMAIKDQPADGTAIGMVVTETLTYNAQVSDSGLTPTDFTLIATTTGTQTGIVAPVAKGWDTFADVIDAAKAGEEIRLGVMSDKLADIAYLLGKANDVEFNIVQVRGGRAVMDGVNAGDMDLGFMAGIQAKGVAAGDLVNLASALSVPLTQTPDAPMMSEYGVNFVADAYFLIVGPGGMAPDVRDAIADAIEDAVSTQGTKSNGMISQVFGGPSVIRGEKLEDMLMREYQSAGALIAAASE